jgi:integrase
MVEKIKCPKRKRKLPIVLDFSEVESLFSVTTNLKHKAMLMITYSSGLRVSETACLKMTDIDGKRMMVRIRQGKGGNDRYSMLSQTATPSRFAHTHRVLYHTICFLNYRLLDIETIRHDRSPSPSENIQLREGGYVIKVFFR